MMKTTSANRMTKMKVIENGSVVKTVANASINYGQDLMQLKKMIEIAIRLSPQDPVYNVDKICIEVGEGKYSEVNPDELIQIQNSLFKVDPSAPTSVGTKVSLKVYVTRPAGSQNNRSVSRIRERDNRDGTVVNNENSKYDNIMRPPSPLHMRQTTTPCKARAQSRGRFVAAPPRGSMVPGPTPSGPSTPGAGLARGASPMRLNRNSVATVAVDNSSSSSDSAPTVVAAATTAPATPATKTANASRVPFSDVLAPSEEIPMDDMVPPPSASKSARKPRRLTQVDMEEEERKKVLQAISQTWTEVGAPTEEAAVSPNKSFLAPFEYYSPTPHDEDTSQMHDEEDFQSCAGDMGDMDLHVDLNENSIILAEEHLESVPEEETEKAPESNASVSDVAPTTPVASSKAPFTSPESRPQTGTPKRSSMMKPTGSAVKKPAQTSTAKESAKPVYPDGRTLAESSASYEHSLRSYRNNPKGTPKDKRKSQVSNKPANANELSPLGFKKQVNRDAEGRPSIGTITTQWEFMRTAFVNNSDEELEWLMISKKAGAYHYAHKKHQMAEDKYFKSLFEIDFYQTQMKVYSGANAKLPSMFNELASKYAILMATPKDEATGEAVMNLHKQTKEYIEKNGGVKALMAPFPPKVEQQLLPLLAEDDKFRIVRKSRDFASLFSSEVAQLGHKYTQAMKDSDSSLENMEKWAKREIETEEYPRIMREQEEEFMNKESEDNHQALNTMRSYFPDNIFDITVQEFQQLVKEKGGLISLELAQELKTNKLLHWIVTHPDDIATSSFLTGDRKAFFENIESLDIIEMRAIAMVLPTKFELDNDGRKAEWRNRFMNRLKQMVSQIRGEKVKGSWDPSKNSRSMIELPPLKPEHMRRSVYYFRTKEASDVKLKQYDDKLALLTKKEAALAKAEQDFKEAKEEYDTVLKEMRDPDFVDQYGMDKLASVKDLAKTEYTNAEKRKKTLTSEVSRLKKSIEDAPITREQFIRMEAEMCEFLTERGVPWSEPNTPAEMIYGIFSYEKVIEKRVQAAAKFVSAEQEAMERKMELSALKNRPAAEAAPVPMETIDENGDSEIKRSFDGLEEGVSGKVAVNIEAIEVGPDTSNAFATPRTERKQSILLSANSEMLNTLNKMFSNMASPNAKTPMTRARTPSRRASMAVTPASNLFPDKEGDGNEGPKEVKQSKSRLLKRLLGGSGEEKKDTAAPPRPGLSFLDQLKARAGGASNTDESAPAIPKPAVKLSFLDQIKARAGLGQSDEVDCGKPKSLPTPPQNEGSSAPAMPPRPQMSFLEQIKSRRREE